MILTITLNPCIDHTMVVHGITLHDRNPVLRTEIDAGGKGVNLSRIVGILGGETVATGFIGGKAGLFVKQVIDDQGVVSDFVQIAGETRTNISVESGDGPPTVFGSPGPTVTEADWHQLLGKVGQHACQGSWVCLGGSTPPGLPENAASQLFELAKKAGARVLLDADGQALERGLQSAPDMVKPNRHEAQRLLKRAITTVGEAVDAAQTILEVLVSHGAAQPIGVVSLGDKGAVVATLEKTVYALPPKVDVLSTIGSGDSFNGAFLDSLISGRSLEDCLRMGVAAGAATAVSDGAHIGCLEDIERFALETVVVDFESSPELQRRQLDD